MGFNIPNSPRRCVDMAAQAAGTATATATGTADVATDSAGFRDSFQSSFRARRRNAIIPGSLSFDALGSPRSPHVFLTRNHRRELAERQEQQLPTTKREPSVRRHADERTHTSDAAIDVTAIP